MKSHYPICLIQGFSGVGKSTLYSSIYKMAPKRTLCLATTGIAALNLMEYGVPFVSTIHSAFSLKPVEMYIYREPEYLKHKTMLDCIDTILIDEASMLDCSLMDWLLSYIVALILRNSIYFSHFSQLSIFPKIFFVKN